MLTPAVLGFATVGIFLLLTFATRISVIVALLIIPVVIALLGGFGSELGGYALDGIKLVAPVAAMIMFAVLYFGLMLDSGLFEPMIRKILSAVKGDPVRLCLATAILPMLVALDGDGATTFLISVSSLLPVHRRLGVDPLVLPAIVGLSAGVMNLLPWGGPTARAMAALDADVGDIFTPVLPAMLAGIAWVLFAAWLMGRRERRRITGIETEDVVPAAEPRASGRFWFNLALTAALIALLFRDLYADWFPIPAMPPALLFMMALAIALPVNRPTYKAQQEQMAAHAPAVVSVTSMILAAGVFTGILSGTGMTNAMAKVLAASIPTSLSGWFPELVAITGMPMSLLFPPDAYYFGILPVFTDAASAMGHDPAAVGRAAILGQMTTGFPLSPLTASTYILIGLSGVSLRDHQRFAFKWAFGTTVVMTIIASSTGAL